MCDCKVGPGKFEGESALTFVAWQYVLDGGGDESTGSEGSLTDWFRFPGFTFEPAALAAALEYGYCGACIDEMQQDVRESGGGGIAVWESDQGFVNSRYYTTRAAFDKALARAEAADAAEGEGE